MKLNYSKLLVAAVFVALLSGGAARASETDDRIVAAAQKSYVFTKHLADDSIKTQSVDGVVTLTGTVKEEYHKSLAYETVASLPGVKSVDNQLKFEGEAVDENSDVWISMQVKYSLLYNRYVSAMNTKVFVTDGVVTLTGEAESQAQKDLSGQCALDVKGVKNLKNEMTIAPVVAKSEKTMGEAIDDASITAQVKMALLTHHSTSAMKTGVTVNNGVVTLTGKTTSGAAKDMTSKVAENVEGVVSVINNMIVEAPLAKK